MYNNIGSKVKGLAKFIGVGGAVFSALGFFITLIVAAASESFDSLAGLIVTFVLLIPGCIIASYPIFCIGDTNEKISRLVEGQPIQTIAPAQIAIATNDLPEL